MLDFGTFGIFDLGVFDSALFDTQPLDHSSDYTVPEQFKGQPNFEGMFAMYATRAQTLEDAFVVLLAVRYIGTAEGAILDEIGESLGEYRRGRTDTEYRYAIYTRIFVNSAKGRTEDVYAAANLLVPGAELHLQEYFPACYIMDIRSDALSPGDYQYVASVLRSIEPPGVRGQSAYSATSGYFGFSDDPDATGFDDGPFREIYE